MKRRAEEDARREHEDAELQDLALPIPSQRAIRQVHLSKLSHAHEESDDVCPFLRSTSPTYYYWHGKGHPDGPNADNGVDMNSAFDEDSSVGEAFEGLDRNSTNMGNQFDKDLNFNNNEGRDHDNGTTDNANKSDGDIDDADMDTNECDQEFMDAPYKRRLFSSTDDEDGQNIIMSKKQCIVSFI